MSFLIPFHPHFTSKKLTKEVIHKSLFNTVPKGRKLDNLFSDLNLYAKKPFVDEVCATGLELISRLRDDADLLYPYIGPHPERREAKTKYSGKLDLRNLDPAYFTCCIEEENYRIFEATLFSKAMKRQIRVAIMHVYRADGTIKLHKSY